MEQAVPRQRPIRAIVDLCSLGRCQTERRRTAKSPWPEC